MNEEDRVDMGLVARLLRARNITAAVAILTVCVVVYLFLDSRPSLPNYSLAGAAYDLIKDAAAGLGVILLGYLVAVVFLGRDKEILSHTEIGRIARRVAKSVQEAVRLPPLDESLLLETDIRSILEQGTKSVYISRETGAVFFNECKNHLKKLLTEGCRISIVLALPNSLAAKSAEFRYSNSNKDFKTRFEKGQNFLQSICSSSQKARVNLSVRYSSFALPSTVLIVDPDTSRTKGVYRQIGNLTETNEERFTLLLNAASSPRLTKVITNEFERIFYTSSKVCLLSADGGFPATDLQHLFPNFFGSPARDVDHLHGLTAVDAPDLFYILLFQANLTGLGSTALFGAGDRKADGCEYGRLGSEGKVGVSFDNLRRIHAELEDAARRKLAIIVANLDAISLALPGQIDRHEFSRADMTRGPVPVENLKFFEEHADPATGILSLSIVPLLNKLMKKERESHLFLHFVDTPEVQTSPFCRAVPTDMRTNVVAREALMRELQGSASAIRYAHTR